MLITVALANGLAYSQPSVSDEEKQFLCNVDTVAAITTKVHVRRSPSAVVAS